MNEYYFFNIVLNYFKASRSVEDQTKNLIKHEK